MKTCLRTLIFLLTPLALIFLITLSSILSANDAEQMILGFRLRWVYVFCLIGIYWMFNVLHVTSVAFIPLVALPLLGTVPAKPLAAIFMSDLSTAVFGSIVLMMAADVGGLRRRLALRILKHSSGSIRWIFIDIYLATIWTAMWINSIAAVYFMMKVIDDILETMKSAVSNGSLGDERMILLGQIQNKPQKVQDVVEATHEMESSTTAEASKENEKTQKKKSDEVAVDAAKAFNTENAHLLNGFGGELLYVAAVAANIGGILWPYGNPMGFDIMKMKYSLPKLDTNGKFVMHGLTEASWMIYSLPLLVINGSIALIFLLGVHFSTSECCHKIWFCSTGKRLADYTQSPGTLKTLGRTFSDMNELLPIWNRKEKTVLILAISAIALCLTRQPVFLTGWAELVHVRADVKKKGLRNGIGDSVSFIIITLLLFLLPSWTLQVFKGPPPTDGNKPKVAGNSLGWKQVQTSYPFAVMFLIGAAGCIGRFSEKPIAFPLSEFLARELPATNTELLKLVMMLITVGVSIFIPNPGTSIALTQLWFRLLMEYEKKNQLVHGASILPILSVASLCFVIPSSSIPTMIAYRYQGQKTLSAWHLLRLGIPLFLCTFIPTVLYALLWTPRSLAVLFI